MRTGETAFKHLFGMDVWQYRALHPEQSKLFDEAMTNLINVINQGILDSFDFSSVHQIVDVGGGNGGLADLSISQGASAYEGCCL